VEGTRGESKGRFRTGTKKYFLTVSQTEVTKEVMMQRVLHIPWPVVNPTTHQIEEGQEDQAYPVSVVIAQETHKLTDASKGFTGKHLHIYIEFSKGYVSRRLNELFNYHLDSKVRMKSVFDVKKLMGYMTKEDTDPLCHNFDIGSCMNKRNPKEGSKMKDIATKLISGESLKQIAVSDEYRGTVVTKLSQLQHYSNFIAEKEPDPFTLVGIRLAPSAPRWQQVIVDFVKAVVLGDPDCKKTFRHGFPSLGRPQNLWVSLPSGAGKSTLLEVLVSVFGEYLYMLPKGDKGWFDNVDSEKHKLWVADEFSGDITIQMLNKISDPGKVCWPRRGKAPAETRGMLGLVLSNGQPHEVYHGGTMDKEKNMVYYNNIMEALTNRFTVVYNPNEFERCQLQFQIRRRLNSRYVEYMKTKQPTWTDSKIALEAGKIFAIPEQILDQMDVYAIQEYCDKYRTVREAAVSQPSTDEKTTTPVSESKEKEFNLEFKLTNSEDFLHIPDSEADYF